MRHSFCGWNAHSGSPIRKCGCRRRNRSACIQTSLPSANSTCSNSKVDSGNSASESREREDSAPSLSRLRDYSEGDDYRKIDWKASARRAKLVVRQFEQERNQCVMICIDIGRHMLAEVNGVRKLDHVLDALLMLTNAAAVAGDYVGLLVYADNVRRYIPPRKSRAQVGIIIEAVHDLIAEPVESDPAAAFAYFATRWKRRALLVSFTDYEDVDRAKELTVAFGPMARRHLALICRVQDPRIDEVLQSTVTDVNDMYRKAAANLLMEDRRAATHLVGAAGIHNLDSEPQDLAAKPVSFYFNVKERSLACSSAKMEGAWPNRSARFCIGGPRAR